MIDYLASFTNTDGAAYPDTAFVNATGPSTTDGTEFVKLFGDDIWGARQALMNRTGLTPDGVTEADGTAQVIEMHNRMCCAPGVGTEWSLALDPATTGHRAILRQGQGILIANYPDLVSAVYVGDGNNAAVAAGGGAFYKADDAAGTIPNIAGTYLILDDYRGVVDRGLDPASSIDPDGASRFLGDLQSDAFQGHLFNLRSSTGTANIFVSDKATGTAVSGTKIGAGIAGTENTVETTGAITDGVNGVPRTSTETRMYNRSVKKVIWY